MKKALTIITAAAMITVSAASVSAQGIQTEFEQSSYTQLIGASVGRVTVKSSYSSSSSAVRIKWNKVSGASGYRIYRQDAEGNWKKIKTITKSNITEYRDSGLNPGTRYRYKVKAYAKKNGKTTWGKASEPKLTATKPSAVKFKSFSATETAIRLNWTPVECEGYQIYQKIGGKYVKIDTIRDKNTATYKVSGLNEGTKYSFKIRAFSKDGAGRVIYTPCAEKVKTTKKFEAPIYTDFTSVKSSGTSCTLTWEAVDCDGYEIYMAGAGKGVSENAPKTFYRLGTDIPNGSVTTATVSNLCSGSTYCFQIVTYKLNSKGEKVYQANAKSGFDVIKSCIGVKEITTEYDCDEVNLGTPAWETENKEVTVKVNYEESFKCLELVNEERVKSGAEPLVMDKDLFDKAVTRLAENTYNFNGNHIRANGLDCFSIYTVGSGSENGGFDGADSAEPAYNTFSGWNGEPLHRGNMLRKDWKSTGLVIIELDVGYGTAYLEIEVFSDQTVGDVMTKPSQKTSDVTKTIEVKKYNWTY